LGKRVGGKKSQPLREGENISVTLIYQHSTNFLHGFKGKKHTILV